MPHEDYSRQFCEGLCHIEIAQWADLKKGHTILLGIGPSLFSGHLPLEGQVQPISHQDTRDSWSMLIYLFDPSVNPIKGPPVGDVINEEDALSSS